MERSAIVCRRTWVGCAGGCAGELYRSAWRVGGPIRGRRLKGASVLRRPG